MMFIFPVLGVLLTIIILVIFGKKTKKIDPIQLQPLLQADTKGQVSKTDSNRWLLIA